MSVINFAERKTVRQGDVFFVPVGNTNYLTDHYGDVANRYGPTIQDVADGIIQRGESTGHDHRLDNDEGMGRRGFLKRVGGLMFVVASGIAGARVVQASTNAAEREGVELHMPVDLEPDTTYQALIAREFDYAAARPAYVRD